MTALTSTPRPKRQDPVLGGAAMMTASCTSVPPTGRQALSFAVGG